MNVLRSLARDLWNVLDVGKASRPEAGAKTLDAVRQKAVPSVLGLSRFRDGFEQFPQGATGTLRALASERAFRPAFTSAQLQRDGFERGGRAPVDLSGGVKPQFQVTEQAPAPAVDASNGFIASLDDVASLLG